MGTKLYIKTFGCQMNEYDSDKTVDILKEKKDVSVTDNPEDQISFY
jgi:tRNA-2-methylthio-N6-dimethylallyladenosine synthase